ncbi:hypothetical protein EXIGLDRAFT_33105 [Exidia glandulosa HHB12029]|uniref:Uncharacterized protein n=1 Tax=Exidia glandulosa HHB12029 TaxID=1314781 RepID=A0A165ISN8_EXIGL|nr:hypothetical protein EXIGLDRAFT_33105 [Exidia glandulosa HHB12029]
MEASCRPVAFVSLSLPVHCVPRPGLAPTMDSSKQSAAGAQDQMSPSDLAALEKAFMEMLSSFEGSPTPVQPAISTARYLHDTLRYSVRH